MCLYRFMTIPWGNCLIEVCVLHHVSLRQLTLDYIISLIISLPQVLLTGEGDVGWPCRSTGWATYRLCAKCTYSRATYSFPFQIQGFHHPPLHLPLERIYQWLLSMVYVPLAQVLTQHFFTYCKCIQKYDSCIFDIKMNVAPCNTLPTLTSMV